MMMMFGLGFVKGLSVSDRYHRHYRGYHVLIIMIRIMIRVIIFGVGFVNTLSVSVQGIIIILII